MKLIVKMKTMNNQRIFSLISEFFNKLRNTYVTGGVIFTARRECGG
jgi:hypothetical protein